MIGGGGLYRNKSEKLQDIKQTIQVKKYWIAYLLNLQGIAVPDNRVCDVFEKENAKLQSQIDVLLEEQSRLKHHYETAEQLITQLENEIAELEDKAKLTKQESSSAKDKIRRAQGLKQKIQALENELLHNLNTKELEELLTIADET